MHVQLTDQKAEFCEFPNEQVPNLQVFSVLP